MSTKNSTLSASLVTRLKENTPEDEGLHDLDLSSSRIGPKEMSILGDVIKQNGLSGDKMAPLITVDLSNNHICGVTAMDKGSYDHEGVADFLSSLLALNKCSRLRRLTLNRNKLNPKACNLLGNYVENVCSALVELNLVNINLTGDAMDRLAEGFKANKSIFNLDISKNPLGTRGGTLLAEMLNPQYCRLRQLNCSSCELGVEGSISVFNSMQINGSINTLIMNDNGFGDQGCEALAQMIKCHGKMKQLELQENNIGIEGITAISKTLAKNRTLLYLGLQWNDLDNAGAARIAEAMLSNNVIRAIHIVGNHIDMEGVKMIINANISITEKPLELDLSFCYRPLKSQVRAERKQLKASIENPEEHADTSEAAVPPPPA